MNACACFSRSGVSPTWLVSGTSRVPDKSLGGSFRASTASDGNLGFDSGSSGRRQGGRVRARARERS